MERVAAAKVKFVDPKAVVGVVPFPVWIWRKEVTVRGGMEGGQLISIMKDKGIVVGDYASNMMQDPEVVVPTDTRTVHTACCEIGDLDFPGTKDPTVPEFLARVKEMKGLCSREVGPHLRYQFTTQSIGEWALVAMEPVSMSLTSRGVFLLGCGNGNNGHSQKLWIEGCAMGKEGVLNRKIKVIIAQE